MGEGKKCVCVLGGGGGGGLNWYLILHSTDYPPATPKY